MNYFLFYLYSTSQSHTDPHYFSSTFQEIVNSFPTIKHEEELKINTVLVRKWSKVSRNKSILELTGNITCGTFSSCSSRTLDINFCQVVAQLFRDWTTTETVARTATSLSRFIVGISSLRSSVGRKSHSMNCLALAALEMWHSLSYSYSKLFETLITDFIHFSMLPAVLQGGKSTAGISKEQL